MSHSQPTCLGDWVPPSTDCTTAVLSHHCVLIGRWQRLGAVAVCTESSLRGHKHWRRQGGPSPPMAGQIFFVKIEGLLEPVVLNLSFRVRSNAMFTSERRY